jgi:hypothetical protein
MNALLLAMLLTGGTPSPAPDETDLRCYRLMADLARAEDPQVRALGLTAASYFLGRIDAASPGYDLARVRPGAESAAEDERRALIGRCADALGAGGLDLRSFGAALARPETTI